MHDKVYNIMTTESKLLFDIKMLLMEQNSLLKQSINAIGQEEKENVSTVNIKANKYKDLDRKELMGLIKKSQNKPKGWTKWSNEEMQDFLIKESEK